MNFMKKLFGKKSPSWAQPISPSLYEDFQRDVIAEFEQQGLALHFEWDLGGATDPETKNQFGFHNLVHIWLDSLHSERKLVVSQFFGEIIRKMGIANAHLSDHFDDLYFRVYDRHSMPALAELPLKPIGENLVACLVIDGEQSLVSVSDDQITESKLEVSELFRLAEENLWKKVTTNIDRKELEFGQLTFIEAKFFGASQLLVLDRYTETGTTYWVAAPQRDLTLLLKPSSESRDFLKKFFEFAYLISNSSPYALSPFVMEFRDGQLKDLVRIDGDRLKLVDG